VSVCQGLDPASRRNLWDVVKASKKDRSIILTTHSMEEAEVLCDRLGIFVDGQLVCIGNPKELTARYGGYLVGTRPPPALHRAQHALAFVLSVCPSVSVCPLIVCGMARATGSPSARTHIVCVLVRSCWCMGRMHIGSLAYRILLYRILLMHGTHAYRVAGMLC
jgi:hypothetical protein